LKRKKEKGHPKWGNEQKPLGSYRGFVRTVGVKRMRPSPKKNTAKELRSNVKKRFKKVGDQANEIHWLWGEKR